MSNLYILWNTKTAMKTKTINPLNMDFQNILLLLLLESPQAPEDDSQQR